MLISISEIIVSTGRREALPKDVQALADSISAVGLLNPVTVDCRNNLIAGFHRLEAAKLLGWAEIECTVCDLEGLQLELAEIDEDFIRKDLSDGEFRELLLHRKKVYEKLHPETKNGVVVLTTGASRNTNERGLYALCADLSEKLYEKMEVGPI